MSARSDTGQILTGSVFGDLLTSLAREAETIVEVGTWLGMGSTQCLYRGLERETQRLFGIEADKGSAEQAAKNLVDFRVSILWGCVSVPDNYLPFAHPDQDAINWYQGEKSIMLCAPFVLDQVPNLINLLLLDGGEWSSDSDFEELIYRVYGVVALDDTNPRKAYKNVRNRERLIREGWQVIYDDLNDRNGSFAARRPK